MAMAINNVSLAEYALLLVAHDWTYQMSDDYRAYRRGRDQRARLCNIRQLSEDHAQLFERAWDKFNVKY